MNVSPRLVRSVFWAFLLTTVIAGCNHSNNWISPLAARSGPTATPTAAPTATPTPGTATGTVFWALAMPTPNPQIEFAADPLTSGTTATQISGSSSNGLNNSFFMLTDGSGRLWVLTNPVGNGSNNVFQVFAQPVTASSTPVLTLTLSGLSVGFGSVAFDKSGNLWGVEYGTGTLDEYAAASLTSSGTVSPSVQIAHVLPNFSADGLAVDGSGNVYLSDAGSTGSNAIAVITAPVTSGSSVAYHLNGVFAPAALVFDSAGNLYAGSSGGLGCSSNCPTNGIVRFNANNLGANATPNISDTAGMTSNDPDPWEGQMAFDSSGNLYVGDCGSHAGLWLYPNAASSFSTSLAPSLFYSDAAIANSHCVEGVAVLPAQS